ncbi:uncharacterized protein LOC128302564 [Anopheles moucheti]|uniref:uncharacterized protein LOC128302564 n=1 Tax=Anopheles moucheti TaxID=186751 RepID=UPI0022F1430B|nr:uncharacterized protein LOC128302564 [Anopheles moucheti]
MKRVADLDCKNVPVGKSREKLLRSRNKRKCKRKKNARTMRMRLWTLKAPANQCSSEQYQRESIHHTPPTVAEPCTEIRLKHAQNVWIRTYQRIVKWHGKHQTNYWKHCAQHLKAENERLKRVMLATRPLANSNDAEESDSDHRDDPFGDTEDESSEELDAIEGSHERLQRQRKRRTSGRDEQRQEREELDEEFLAFMEVSARHRLEHRRLKNESVH